MFGSGRVSRGIAHHPYFIKKIEDLPVPLLQLAVDHRDLFERIDFMAVVPEQTILKAWFGHRVVPQQAILFYPGGMLHLQAPYGTEQPGKASRIESQDVILVCSSLLLLYGKLEILAHTNTGVQRIEVEYNTVAHEQLKPYILRLVRESWQKPVSVPEDLTRVESPDILALPYKFQSGLKIYALQPEEELCGLVFQPEILEPRLGFFRRKTTPNTLFAATDQQILLIEEEIQSASNYGWVITYIPRHRVSEVETMPFREWQAVRLRTGAGSDQQEKTVILQPAVAEQCMHMLQGAAA